MTSPRPARPLRWAAAAAVLALGLAGCSSEGHDSSASAPSPTPSSSTSSAVPASATPTTERSTAPSSRTSSATAPSAKTTTEAAEAKDDAADSTAVAAPGTKCGSPKNLPAGTVYVSGGPVSCAEAVALIEKYEDRAKTASTTRLAMDVDGYGCEMGSDMMHFDARLADCVNRSNGAYVEVQPKGKRILSGPVADPEGYRAAAQGTADEEYSDGFSAVFTTPDKSTGCGISNRDRLNCWSIAEDQIGAKPFPGALPFHHASMSGTGGAKTTVEPGQDLRIEMTGKPLDRGTVMNAKSYSCQAATASSMHCVNPEGGFTISEQGVTKD